jgi:hypothetical protein
MFCTSAEVPGNLVGILDVPSQTLLTVGITGNVALLSFPGKDLLFVPKIPISHVDLDGIVQLLSG